MAIKVDNSYSTSDALRRYSKGNAQPFPGLDDEEARAEAPSLPQEKGMDRITLSRHARQLLAGEPLRAIPFAEPSGGPMVYSARAVLVQSK